MYRNAGLSVFRADYYFRRTMAIARRLQIDHFKACSIAAVAEV